LVCDLHAVLHAGSRWLMCDVHAVLHAGSRWLVCAGRVQHGDIHRPSVWLCASAALVDRQVYSTGARDNVPQCRGNSADTDMVMCLTTNYWHTFHPSWLLYDPAWFGWPVVFLYLLFVKRTFGGD